MIQHSTSMITSYHHYGIGWPNHSHWITKTSKDLMAYAWACLPVLKRSQKKIVILEWLQWLESVKHMFSWKIMFISIRWEAILWVVTSSIFRRLGKKLRPPFCKLWPSVVQIACRRNKIKRSQISQLLIKMLFDNDMLRKASYQHIHTPPPTHTHPTHTPTQNPSQVYFSNFD